jgi:hypothetical protein
MNGDYDNLRNKIPFAVARAGLVAGLVVAISACAQAGSAITASSSEKGQAVKPIQPRDKLPYAGDRQFRTLDEYLAYRRTLGATDRPWYEEISPGVYKLTGGRRLPGSPNPTYMRRELLEKFGFSH